MSDMEKFEVFKEKIVQENEEKYGKELREKYGDEEMDASNKKLLNMSEADYERFRNLGQEIRTGLKECVNANVKPDSEEAKRIVILHKEWLEMTWKQYTPEAHKGVAKMYICDERFKAYYDAEVPGCANLLEQAVRCWADKI